MTIYLRTLDNKTLVDIEVSEKDLSSVVNIKNYSNLLWSIIANDTDTSTWRLNNESILEFIEMFDSLQELRGWLNETYMATQNKNPTKQEIVNQVTHILTAVAVKYNLSIVTD